MLTDDGIELDDEERDQMIQTISQEGQDVLHLVEDLLATARADAGELAVTSVSVNLRAQAAQVLESLEARVGQRYLAAGRVRCGPWVIRPGSARFCATSSRMRCATAATTSRSLLPPRATQARVTVSDDGPAIPPDDVERIFEPYQRAQAARATTASVGLGLSVSRQLARLMGGSLVYRHEQGRSSFRLALPAQSDDG